MPLLSDSMHCKENDIHASPLFSLPLASLSPFRPSPPNYAQSGRLASLRTCVLAAASFSPRGLLGGTPRSQENLPALLHGGAPSPRSQECVGLRPQSRSIDLPPGSAAVAAFAPDVYRRSSLDCGEGRPLSRHDSRGHQLDSLESRGGGSPSGRASPRLPPLQHLPILSASAAALSSLEATEDCPSPQQDEDGRDSAPASSRSRMARSSWRDFVPPSKASRARRSSTLADGAIASHSEALAAALASGGAPASGGDPDGGSPDAAAALTPRQGRRERSCLSFAADLNDSGLGDQVRWDTLHSHERRINIVGNG